MLKVDNSQLTVLRETVEDGDSDDSDSDDMHIDLANEGAKQSMMSEEFDYSQVMTRRAEADARLAKVKEKIA